MLQCSFFHEQLKKCGVGMFAGVPDSLLKDYCAYLDDHATSREHVITANEGGAVALALGHHLATGGVGLAYMQNSGQGNTINPLLSLCDSDVYGVPVLLLVGWRGEPSIKDEPQHVKQGKVTLDVFDVMGIPYKILPDAEADAAQVIIAQTRLALSEKRPVALVVRKGIFARYHPEHALENEYLLTRERAVGCVANALDRQAAVVSTTGKISRELYEHRAGMNEDHAKDFLTVGGMGHASMIALGISMAHPQRTVCCLDGDGAALMHMGAMGIVANSPAGNFIHVLLNNGAHDSVGGQPSVGFDVDFCAVAEGLGYRRCNVVSTLQELKSKIEAFHVGDGPVLIEVRVALGSRENLGRPKTTPTQNKAQFMEFLQDDSA